MNFAIKKLSQKDAKCKREVRNFYEEWGKSSGPLLPLSLRGRRPAALSFGAQGFAGAEKRRSIERIRKILIVSLP